MIRLLIPILAVAGIILMPGQSHAQLLGVTVCGKTVGIGVGGAPAGYGYGYGAGYGAAPAAPCPLGLGFGAPGYGYGAPSYGAAPAMHCPIGFGHHAPAVGYGYSYSPPAYGGSSCHGGFGMAYGAPNYGSSCNGGGPGMGYSGPLVGYHYHPAVGTVVGVTPPNQNVGVPGPIIHWDPSNDPSVPHLGGSKKSTKLDTKPGAGRGDFAATMADIDRAQASRAMPTGKAKATATEPNSGAGFAAILADIDRAQARKAPRNRTDAASAPDRTGSGGH